MIMKSETFTDTNASKLMGYYQKRSDKDQFEVEIDSNKNQITIDVPQFKCPRHHCDTCFEEYGPNNVMLHPCEACPRAFHETCVPPGYRLNSWAMLCPLHPEMALPAKSIDDFTRSLEKETVNKLMSSNQEEKSSTTSIASSPKKKTKNGKRKDKGKDEDDVKDEPEEGQEAEEEEEQFYAQEMNSDDHEFMKLKKTISNFYSQLYIPESDKDSEDLFKAIFFRLPYSLKEDVEMGPKDFKEITRNNYEPIIKKGKSVPDVVPEFGCECKDICDYKCLNRVMHVECSGGKARSGDLICRVGKQCTNRQLQNRDYAAFEVFSEENMGLGLRAMENVSKGTLVIEYIGEIIDDEEMNARMNHQHEFNPYDKDYYVMQLTNDFYVDGKKEGNFSRFINHSCDPNCELQRWNVNSKTRIAIVAIKDIAEGEPFSYDYQFETQQEDTFKCYCKTSKCRGTMAPNTDKRMMKMAKSGKNEGLRTKLILMGREREKDSQSHKMLKEEELGRCYTCSVLPGEKSRLIAQGPVKNTFPLGRANNVFLVRNIVESNQFLKRKETAVSDFANNNAGFGSGSSSPVKRVTLSGRESKRAVRYSELSTTLSEKNNNSNSNTPSPTKKKGRGRQPVASPPSLASHNEDMKSSNGQNHESTEETTQVKVENGHKNGKSPSKKFSLVESNEEIPANGKILEEEMETTSIGKSPLKRKSSGKKSVPVTPAAHPEDEGATVDRPVRKRSKPAHYDDYEEK
jgi:hypothetical protein